MNLFTKTALCSVFIVAISSLLTYNVEPSMAGAKAKAVVDLYMSGLFSGDIETIKHCLGKEFQERRKNTLRDPNYVNFLINRYNGATYRVLKNQEQENGRKRLDVEITFGSSETMTIQLILNRSNKIIDEIII